MRQFMTRALTALALGACALTAAPRAEAQLIDAERIATGLDRPLYVTHAPGDFERIFIVEQRGTIRVMRNGVMLGSFFLNITSLVDDAGNEQGLLGLAFHPDFQSNGKFYVSFTENNGTDLEPNTVWEYTVSANPDVADASSGRRIISDIFQRYSNHNGGWIGFGPDGYLYMAIGDGGFFNDPDANGQNPNTLTGSMLRIDVDGDDFPADTKQNYAIPIDNPFDGMNGRAEIWAWGLRNPWRNSFDRLTGDLYIADVGQGAQEEVNIQSVLSIGGENYGWRCMEGFDCTGLSGCVCNGASLKMPALDYSRTGGRCSITGGYVYRGCAIPELQGLYFYADYCSGDIWTAQPDVDNNLLTNVVNRRFDLDPPGSISVDGISSFGEDAYGELYITDLFGGELFKIVPQNPAPMVDCNENGIEDACEILDGSADANGNGVVDDCEVSLCTADFDGVNGVNLDDFSIFIAQFGNSAADCMMGCTADLDGVNGVDLDDFSIFIAQFGNSAADCGG